MSESPRASSPAMNSSLRFRPSARSRAAAAVAVSGVALPIIAPKVVAAAVKRERNRTSNHLKIQRKGDRTPTIMHRLRVAEEAGVGSGEEIIPPLLINRTIMAEAWEELQASSRDFLTCTIKYTIYWPRIIPRLNPRSPSLARAATAAKESGARKNRTVTMFPLPLLIRRYDLLSNNLSSMRDWRCRRPHLVFWIGNWPTARTF
mmetsp:Transcript_12747/g.31117  ORF Transcript_12747/g.31117 Transcript_12747/m.31117 type:complete len:204 (-) Transcript_12747:543-1154(-)